MENSKKKQFINSEQNTDYDLYDENAFKTISTNNDILSNDCKTDRYFYNSRNEMAITNYFTITNKTQDNNFYSNHKKTMTKLKKCIKHNRNHTLYLNNIKYNTNKCNYPIIKHKCINSQTIDLINRPFINKNSSNYNHKVKNNKFKYKRFIQPKIINHEIKEELFPKFNFLNPKNKELYYKLITKNKKSILNSNNEDLDIDNEIINVKNTNYITNKMITERKNDFFQTNINYDYNLKNNNNLIKEKNRIFEIPFYKKITKFKTLNQFKYTISNPVERCRVKEFFKNFETIKTVNLMNDK